MYPFSIFVTQAVMHPKQSMVANQVCVFPNSPLSSVSSQVSVDLWDLLSLMGLKRRPKGMQNNTNAPIILKVHDQPKFSFSKFMMGAKIKVPKPEPLLAMPVAIALFLSK